MDTQKSGKFFVGSIVTFVILFFLVNIILSIMQGMAKNIVAPESMSEEDIAERIKPVAEVYVGEPPVVEAAPIVEASALSGGQVVSKTCALCHRSGMMESPKLGNAEDWAPRIEKGMDVLYDHAINGFNMMPARGTNPSLSDDEVKAAVDHMLSLVE
ncbi:MAG: c-type cytochrome [Methylophagaceae bacterium]